MSQYGAAQKKKGSIRADLEAGRKTNGPIFLENPDGTIAEAVPSNIKEKPAPPRPSARHRDVVSEDSDGSLGNLSENAATTLFQEVDFLYNQHARVLFVLLLLHVALVVLYNFVFVYRIQDGGSMQNVKAMYGWQDRGNVAGRILWTVFGLQLTYHAWFYFMAVAALWTGRPSYYRDLANCGIFGIIGMVFFAYVDKFNLLIFFLNLLIYIYARFMQGLTASLLLLPSGPPASTAAAAAAAP